MSFPKRSSRYSDNWFTNCKKGCTPCYCHYCHCHKIATLGRRRKLKEAQEVENLLQQGYVAIDQPKTQFDALNPSEFILENNEERWMIDPKSRMEPNVQYLIKVLIEWINDTLYKTERILVKDLEEDLYDGQILGKLYENLTQTKLETIELTQSEERQRQKLQIVTEKIDQLLSMPYEHNEWTPDAILSKDLISICRICSALALFFSGQSDDNILQKLLENPHAKKLENADNYNTNQNFDVYENVLGANKFQDGKNSSSIIQSQQAAVALLNNSYLITTLHVRARGDGTLAIKRSQTNLISLPPALSTTFELDNLHLLGLNSKSSGKFTRDQHSEYGYNCNTASTYTSTKDAFDTLFAHAPEKLDIVRKSLLTFARKHLSAFNIDVYDLEEQFNDGCLFILLLSQLENVFIPLYLYHQEVQTHDDKVHNVNFVLELMAKLDYDKTMVTTADVVNKDLKAILRLLYAFFSKSKLQSH